MVGRSKKIQPEDAERLASLLAELPDSASVELGAGRFCCPEPIVISKSLSISGAGMGLTHLVKSFEGPAPILTVAGRGSIHLEHLSTSGSGVHLFAATGHLDLLRCIFNGQAIDGPTSGGEEARQPDEFGLEDVGVRLEGKATSKLRRCHFVELAVGVELLGGASAAFEDSVHVSGSVGAVVGADANATFKACTFEAGCRLGLSVLGRASVDVAGGSAGSKLGIALSGDGRVNASGVFFHSPSEVGVCVENSGRLDVDACRFEELEVGVEVWDRGVASIERSRFDGCVTGAQLGGGSSVDVRESSFRKCERYGVVVSDEARPRLTSNTFESCKIAGVAFGGRSEGSVSDNSVESCSTGLVISERARPRVEKNRFTKNLHHGVLIKADAAPFLMQNTASYNKRTGISIKGRANCRASGNTVTFNGCGLLAAGMSSVIFSHNTCSHNDAEGIKITDHAGGTIEANTCEHGYHGAMVSGHANPVLKRNNLRNNSVAGVFYSDQARGFFEANSCNENEVGIWVLRGAEPVLRGNRWAGNLEAHRLPLEIPADNRVLVPIDAIAPYGRSVRSVARLRRLEGSYGVGVAASFLLASVLLSPWFVSIFVALILAVFVGLAVSKRRLRKAIMTDGVLLEGRVSELDPEKGRAVVMHQSESGQEGATVVWGPRERVAQHVLGVVVPVIVDPLRRVRPIFPTLEGVDFSLENPASDTRPGRPEVVLGLELPPAQWSLDCALHRVPPRRQMGALNPQTGTLSWTQTSVVHRSEAEGTVAALDLSTPFFVLLSVWLTSDDMAELSVVCRVRGSAADQVVFCVERPQRLLSREIPLKMRRSSFISAGEFEVVWPILRQAARLHGSDPGPLV